MDPKVRDRTVVIESFSKTYSMTGYRLGAAIGPPALIEAMISLVTTSATHPAVVSQHAGLAALSLDESWRSNRLEALRRRRDRTVRCLAAIPGIHLAGAEAGLYVFPEVSGLACSVGVADVAALCALMLEELGLLLVPGSAFGAPGHLRLSWCIEDERLETGLKRIERRFGREKV